MSSLAAAPVAALTFLGVLLVVLGIFAGGVELMLIGLGSLVGGGAIGALASRRA